MEAIFSKERVGFRFNTHVIYYPLWFSDRKYYSGDLYFEGKTAFKELKEFCRKNNYTHITIQSAKKQKQYEL